MGLTLLTACHGTIQIKPEQQNLLKKCADEMPLVNGLNGKELTAAFVAWWAQYEDCKTRHNGLVDVIKGDEQ